MTSWKLLLTCTDRGQHATTALGSIRKLEGGLTQYMDDEDARRTARNPRRSGETHVRADGGVTYSVRCPRCRRDTRLRLETVVTLVDAGRREVDISALP